MDATYAPLAADYHWLYDDIGLRIGTTTPGVRGALVGLAPGARVLDAACGIGLDAIALARRGFAVTGADASAAMLGEARRRVTDAGCTVTLVHSTWSELPAHVAPASFDAVLCAGNSIAHAGRESDMMPALGSFAEVLRPGGLLIADTHNWDLIDRDGDCEIVDPVVVDRDGVRCTRTYTWRRELDGSGSWKLVLGFELDDGAGTTRRRHAVVLHPFTPAELRDRLRRSGFVQLALDVNEHDDRYTAVARRRAPVSRSGPE